MPTFFRPGADMHFILKNEILAVIEWEYCSGTYKSFWCLPKYRFGKFKRTTFSVFKDYLLKRAKLNFIHSVV